MDKDKRIRPSKRKSGFENEAKPTTLGADDIDIIDQEERERVLEGLSIAVPTRPLPKLAKPFWVRYVGQRVLLLLRDRTEIQGILQSLQWDFVRLENVFEVGRTKRVTADWVILDSSSVTRVYPANAHIEHKD